MKVAAGRADRRQDWITAFRRSWRRAVIRRLPNRIARWVLTANRWQRRLVERMRGRWHRSLQLRVVSTTLVLSALVIAVLGFFLVQSIASDLLSSAVRSASEQVESGRTSALGQPGVLGQQNSQFTEESVAQVTARSLQQSSGDPPTFLVFILLTSNAQASLQWVGQRNVNVTATIPQTLINQVTA